MLNETVRIDSVGLESTRRAREERLQREGAAWIQRTAWKEGPQHKHGDCDHEEEKEPCTLSS